MRVAAARLAGAARVAAALRHPQFRLYWTGLLLSVLGFQVLMVAQAWVIYDLTGSPRYLGLLGLATAAPTIVLNLVGGAVADRVDQRRLLILTQGTSALLVAALATLVALGTVSVWHVLAIAFIGGGVLAFDTPTRQSLYPHLIDRKDLMNAVALNSAIWQGTRIVGPALGGVLIGSVGTAAAFYVAAGGFLGMAALVAALRVPPIPRGRGGSVLGSIGEGVGYIRRSGVFSFLIGTTFFNSFFGLSYIFLLPVFAVDILAVGAEGLGFLQGVSGTGALAMTFVAAAMGNARAKGLLLVSGAALFGMALVGFAYSTSYLLSLALLFVAGSASTLYMVLVMTTLQAQVPDELRGRVMGIYGMTWSIMPLGAVQAGFIAELVSAPFAVALGGILVAGFAVGTAAASGRVRRLGEPVAGASQAGGGARVP